MKSLKDYTEKKQTALFKETGTFFAFGREQFDESRNPKIRVRDYVNAGPGMFVPKANLQKLKAGLDKIYKEGIAQDIKENGREAIIIRELNNYECFYTRDPSDCVVALSGYGFTEEEIRETFNSSDDGLRG